MKNARRFRQGLLAAVCLLVFVLLGGIGLVAARASTFFLHPPRHTADTSPASIGISDFEEVHLRAKDGVDLEGWYLPPPANSRGDTLIYVHGFGGHRGNLLGQAAIFHRHGYGGLLLDSRNHGRSGGTLTTFGYFEVRDIEAAIEYLQKKRSEYPEARLGIVGHSMGAATAIRSGAMFSELAIIVAESGFRSLKHNVNQVVQKLGKLPPFPFAPMVIYLCEHEAKMSMDSVVPESDVKNLGGRGIMFVHGRKDSLIDVSDSETMYQVATEPKALYIVDEAHHNDIFSANPEAFERVVLEFVDRVLAAPAPL